MAKMDVRCPFCGQTYTTNDSVEFSPILNHFKMHIEITESDASAACQRFQLPPFRDNAVFCQLTGYQREPGALCWRQSG